MDYTKELKGYLDREIEVIKALDVNSINTVMNVLEETKAMHKTTYICGNGGSAATASHFVCDFNKGLNDEASQFKFHCLSDNTPIMMAIANDIGYEEIFRFQLKNKISENDLFIGISGSGNSKNVLNAAEYAKKCGIPVIVHLETNKPVYKENHCRCNKKEQCYNYAIPHFSFFTHCRVIHIQKFSSNLCRSRIPQPMSCPSLRQILFHLR